ncbi:unnamed protein product [Arabidopsis lyrata]|nr:unnamed protein product [Arabidopsis lyrata]
MAPKRKKPFSENENSKAKKRSKSAVVVAKENEIEMFDAKDEGLAKFLDDPISDHEARLSWPQRYKAIEKKKVVARLSKKKK